MSELETKVADFLAWFERKYGIKADVFLSSTIPCCLSVNADIGKLAHGQGYHPHGLSYTTTKDRGRWQVWIWDKSSDIIQILAHELRHAQLLFAGQHSGIMNTYEKDCTIDDEAREIVSQYLGEREI